MGILKRFFNQTRRPEGALGRLMLASMNPGHAKLGDWGMAALEGVAPKRIAELGCGGGRNAGELLRRYREARVTAVDYSPLSVEKAKAYNRGAVEAGRCEVLAGDVSDLPLDSSAYDLVTAFETIYFWPGLEKCFAEAARVLKPEGLFLIVNESDGEDSAGERFEKIIEGMRVYRAEEIESALRAAGFSGVKTLRHPSKPWIALLARKGEDR